MAENGHNQFTRFDSEFQKCFQSTRFENKFQISDLRQRLSPMTSVWSNPTSRSNSSNSMSSPSAKSSASSADSFMSFPRLTPRLTSTPRGSIPRGSTPGSSSTRHFLTNNPWDQRSNTPLPKILPKLPECVIDYDQIIGGSLTQFIRFSSKFLVLYKIGYIFCFIIKNIIMMYSQDKSINIKAEILKIGIKIQDLKWFLK